MSLVAPRRAETSGSAPLRRPRRSPRRLALSAGLVAVATVVLAACWSPAQGNDVALINSYRSSQRKAALTGDIAAMNKAQAWSQHMAATRVLEHTGGGTKIDTRGVTGWCGYYENVGYGATVDAVHASFIASATHRANMLSPSHRVGTGVYQSGNRVWVTEIYLRNC